MRSRFVRFLNAPLLLLAVCVGLAIQSSLFYSYPLHYFQPDFAFLAVLWVSLRRNFTEGGILTLIIGMIVESHSAAPQGYFMLLYMLLYLGMRAFVRYFVIANWASLSLVAMVAHVLFKIAGLFVLALFDQAGRQMFHFFIQIVPSTLMAGILAVFFFPLCTEFDRLTQKTSRGRSVFEEELMGEEAP